MPSARPDFPAVIDSTMRSAFVSCPQRFALEFLHGWVPNRPSIHLHAGAAFAKGLEAARRCFFGEAIASREQAEHEGYLAFIKAWGEFETDSEDKKSFENMLATLAYYFDTYPLDVDPVKPLITPLGPAVEFSFVCEIPGTRHPQTGQPILYSGRFDMIAELEGTIYGHDDKTASQLGPSWTKQWRMRGQFTGYCWGAREYGYPLAGVIVRGISILKNGNGNMQDIQFRAGWEIDRWLEQLRRDVSRMIACWEIGQWDYSLGEACASYGGCTYMQICSTPNPEVWLAADYIQRKWDPTNPGGSQ